MGKKIYFILIILLVQLVFISTSYAQTEDSNIHDLNALSCDENE